MVEPTHAWANQDGKPRECPERAAACWSRSGWRRHRPWAAGSPRLDSRPVVRPSIRMAVVPTGHLLPQISRATRAVDLRGQPRGRPRNDRNLRRKGAQRPGQDLGLWMLKVERQQGQPSRRQPGWMDGIAPSMRKGMGPPPSALGGDATAAGSLWPRCGPAVHPSDPSLPFVLPGTFSRASAGQRTVSIRG